MVLSRAGRWSLTSLFVSCIIIFYRTAPSAWNSRIEASTWWSAPPASIQASSPTWLLAIFVAPADVARRDLIRATWLSRFRHSSFEHRFVVGNLETTGLASELNAENETYGDIWELKEYTNENYDTANRIKNVELFKHMVQELGQGARKYDFVSKVDSDIWFNVPRYHEIFMAPRLPGGDHYNASAKIIIGRPMVWESPYVYASGRLYTVSWPLLEFFAKKYEENPQPTLTEDKLLGMYLYEDGVELEFVVMELDQAWDIGLEGVVDARDQTMLIHAIKDLERISDLNAIFDDEGKWNGKTISGLTNFNRTMPEVVHRIGEPTEQELHLLQASWADSPTLDPKQTIDWQLIREKINVENRQRMGDMYPLNLRGNNASTAVTPALLKHLGENKMVS